MLTKFGTAQTSLGVEFSSSNLSILSGSLLMVVSFLLGVNWWEHWEGLGATSSDFV